MDVEGSDQRGGPRGGAHRRELRDRPPGPEPSRTTRVAIPANWPEAVTFQAGWRLAEAEEDTVPQLLRLEGEVTAWLTPEEIGAQLALGPVIWQRWFYRGWLWWELNQEGR